MTCSVRLPNAPNVMDTNGTDEPDTPSLIRWTSQAEVQRRLGVSRTTLYRWRTLHGLPAATVGRRLFYSVDDIDALLRRASAEAR